MPIYLKEKKIERDDKSGTIYETLCFERPADLEHRESFFDRAKSFVKRVINNITGVPEYEAVKFKPLQINRINYDNHINNDADEIKTHDR